MQKEQGFALKCKDGLAKIAFADLVYVEVMNKTVFFHMEGGAVYEATAALADFEGELLARTDFIKTHRSYIVNLSCVQSIGAHCAITKNGISVPISRQRRSQVQDAYLRFLHETETAEISNGTKESGAPTKKEGRTDGPWQILLVDDDPAQRSYWAKVLQSHGCIAYQAKNGGEAVELVKKESFDCVLLDVMIPGEDGFSICEKLHALTGAPVIFLSCMSDADKQMEGFASGGIDYITKDTPPQLFWTKVSTRIKLSASDRAQMQFGPLLLDLKEQNAFMDGERLMLTPSEFEILWRISESAGRIVTPEEIFGMVWGDPSPEGGQTVQMHMSRLRKKLDRAQEGHCFIETVWGEGYRFVPPGS